MGLSRHRTRGPEVNDHGQLPPVPVLFGRYCSVDAESVESRGTLFGGGPKSLAEMVSDRVPVGGRIQGHEQRHLRSLAPLPVDPVNTHACLTGMR
jgi:hypothetical protein